MGATAGWVDGLALSGRVEISDDPQVLDDGRWWAVIGSYEGSWIFATFESVIPGPLPHSDQWPSVGAWSSSLTQSQYCASVERMRQLIARGEIYQANLCRILSAPTETNSLLALANRIQSGNPAPFFAWFDLPDLSVVCASPERFLERNGKHILSSPIKGTAAAMGQMLEKDRAENIMIVDLVRHDLSRIAEPGSVRTPRLLVEEQHPGLVHLVSDIECQIRDGVNWSQILEATFPAGSITGAPKSSAMKAIAQEETAPRGPYCGAIGWIQGDRARLAVGIRTFYLKNKMLHFGTGAGITWGSDPEMEWKETELKAKRLIGLTQ